MSKYDTIGLSEFNKAAVELWLIEKLHRAQIVGDKLAEIITPAPLHKELATLFTPLGFMVYQREFHLLLEGLSKRFRIKGIVLIVKTREGNLFIPYNRRVRSYVRNRYKVLLETDKFWIIEV